MAPPLARVELPDALFCWPVSEFNITQNACQCKRKQVAVDHRCMNGVLMLRIFTSLVSFSIVLLRMTACTTNWRTAGKSPMGVSPANPLTPPSYPTWSSYGARHSQRVSGSVWRRSVLG